MDNSSSLVMTAFYFKVVFWATHLLQILTLADQSKKHCMPNLVTNRFNEKIKVAPIQVYLSRTRECRTGSEVKLLHGNTGFTMTQNKGCWTSFTCLILKEKVLW